MQRWRNALNLKFSLGQMMQSNPGANYALFHSTPYRCQKRKTKWDDFRSSGKHIKDHVRFQCRQKRADSKKALRDLIDKGFPNLAFEGWNSRRKFERVSDWDGEPEDYAASSRKQARTKHHSRTSEKVRKQRLRRKLRNEDSDNEFDDYDGPSEKVFYATFGGRKFTWSFNGWNRSFTFDDMNDFHWWAEDNTHSNYNRREWRWNKNFQSQSSNESYDTYTHSIGSATDRTLLGLSPTGPLKIEEVKVAFRQSALRWHPDKHEGASKATAEEKFKLCVNAYNSLCSALEST